MSDLLALLLLLLLWSSCVRESTGIGNITQQFFMKLGLQTKPLQLLFSDNIFEFSKL